MEHEPEAQTLTQAPIRKFPYKYSLGIVLHIYTAPLLQRFYLVGLVVRFFTFKNKSSIHGKGVLKMVLGYIRRISMEVVAFLDTIQGQK